MQRFIRRPEVLKKTGLSATTIYNLERRGEFPQHTMLTPRCAAWAEQDVDAWLDSRRAKPAKAQAPHEFWQKKASALQVQPA